MTVPRVAATQDTSGAASVSPIAIPGNVPGPVPEAVAVTPHVTLHAKERKKGTPRPVQPCQACGRTLDSNRYMSAGLKDRITKHLPGGIQFKVKDVPASIAPIDQLPKLRTDASFLCQSCIKYLNNVLKEYEDKENPKGDPQSATTPAPPPACVPVQPPRVQAIAPAPAPASAAMHVGLMQVQAAIGANSRTPGRTNASSPPAPAPTHVSSAGATPLAPMHPAVPAGIPAGTPTQLAGEIAMSSVTIAPPFSDVGDERGRIQDERAALQEERMRFLNDRAKLQDERAQLAAELHQARLEVKTLQEENARLRHGLATLCDDIVRRTRELVPPVGSIAPVSSSGGSGCGKRARLTH